MRLLSLCSGYEGLGMAAEEITGGTVTAYAENDDRAIRVMRAHFPRTPNLGDIKRINWTDFIGEFDGVVVGFSCQDISNAGPRVGISGKRSSIWKDIAEGIRVLQPRVVFLENVAAIRHRDRGIDVVLGDLAACGYDARWTCLPASFVGAAHKRDRWFCIAVPNSESFRRPQWWTESTEQQRGV